MYSNRIISEAELDQEWLSLIAEAKKAGLTIAEIRDFLTNERQTQEIQQAALQKDAIQRLFGKQVSKGLSNF